MTDHDYMTDWTPEEREATRGMPPNVAVGFVAARRGTDVRDVHGRYDRLKAHMDNLIKTKTSGEQVSEAELRTAFEKFSADFPSRTQEES